MMQSFERKNHKKGKIILVLVMIFSVMMIGLFGYLYYMDIITRPLIEYPKYMVSTVEWTSNNITITVLESEKISEYSFDGGENYQEANTYEVLTNDDFMIMVKDVNGRTSKITPVSIRTIDKEPPMISFEENTTVQLGSTFSLRSAVNAYDEGSGLSNNFVTVPEIIDTNVAGTYTVHYTAFDKVGNYTEKVRTITVADIQGKTYYRSRSIGYENYQCEPYSCNCVISEVATLNTTCPTGYTFGEPNKCCQTCYKTCRKAVYGEWSEWTQDKILPNAVIEVETKVE